MKKKRTLLYSSILILLLSFPGYFHLSKPSEEPDSPPDSCGCRPEYPGQTYALHSMSYDKKVAPWWKAEDRDASFNILSRVGFLGFTLNDEGALSIDDDEDIRERKAFIQAAHVYGTRVDMVVGFHENGETKPLSRNEFFVETCVAQIMDAVHQYDFDGVTMSIGGFPKHRVPAHLKDLVINLIDSLHKKLKNPETQKGKKVHFINILFTDEENALMRQFDLKRMEEKIDLILFRLNDKDEDKHCFDYFIDKEIDPRKMVYVLPSPPKKEKPEEEKPGEEEKPVKEEKPGFNYIFKDVKEKKLKLKYNTIIGTLKSGVGFDLIDYPKNRKMLAAVFSKKLDPESFDDRFILKQLSEKYFPGLCKAICPYRSIEWILFTTAASIYLIFLASSQIICVLKAFRKKYRLHIYTVGAGLLVPFYIIILCDPTWEGELSNVMFATIIFLMGMVLKYVIQAKRKSEYP